MIPLSMIYAVSYGDLFKREVFPSRFSVNLRAGARSDARTVSPAPTRPFIGARGNGRRDDRLAPVHAPQRGGQNA